MWPFSKDVISRSEHLILRQKGQARNSQGPATRQPHTASYNLANDMVQSYALLLLHGEKGVTTLLLSAREVKGPWLMGKAYSGEKDDITNGYYL